MIMKMVTFCQAISSRDMFYSDGLLPSCSSPFKKRSSALTLRLMNLQLLGSASQNPFFVFASNSSVFMRLHRKSKIGLVSSSIPLLIVIGFSLFLPVLSLGSILLAKKLSLQPIYELKISAHYCSPRTQQRKLWRQKAWVTSEVMSIVVDVNRVSDINQDDENIYERLKKAAQDGDIERLYGLIAEDPNILGHFDKVPFCESPLHIAAEKGQTHFAMELMTLKPSLALKLNTSGFSPMHLALQNNHIRMVRGFMAIDSSLVSIKGRGRTTPLHHVAQRGDAELLSEFLFACPSSVEDLTIKCETAMHIAVKNHQFEAFKVLLGWVQRVNREYILDWKDEDGNTVFHIAASVNQTEVMKLLRRTVKVKAKNLDGKTAMDILQTHKSPLFPKASRLLRVAKERLLCGSTMTLGGYLSKKPSFIEKRNSLLGLTNLSKTRHRSQNSSDSRSVILVVAILIVTATYQAGLSPPGGFWQEDSPNSGDGNHHVAGKMAMSFYVALYFHALNGIAFFSSLYVILILIVGLPMWKVLYGSTAVLGIANVATFVNTFPSPQNVAEDIILGHFIRAYPLTVASIVFAPFVAFFVNKYRRNRVDFPAKYFSLRSYHDEA